MIEEKLLDKEEMAFYLGVTKRTVEIKMSQGLPHIKLSARATRFRLADVQAWLDGKKVVRIGTK